MRIGPTTRRLGVAVTKLSRILPTLVTLVLAAGSPAAAQCTEAWLPSDELMSVDALVRSMVTWDPDGKGPAPELLVIGGQFTTVGLVAANRIAGWDGVEWRAFGTGLGVGGSVESVRALTVFNGHLVAGGTFTTAGGTTVNRVAQWDGVEWQPLGTGVNNDVRALTVFEGNLIAGGRFTSAGGVAASRVAVWDGSSWSPLGAGLSNTLNALIVHDGSLIAGGEFIFLDETRPSAFLGRWDGQNWLSVGGGAPGVNVNALATYGGDLIAGGGIGLDAWTGSQWTAVGGGISCDGCSVIGHILPPNCSALGTWGSRLVVSFLFNHAGGIPASRIAIFDGKAWQPMGPGLSAGASAIHEFQGQLFVGGAFADAGGTGSPFLARWAPLCAPADLNADGMINSLDLGILLSSWSIPPRAAGCGGALPCVADLDHNGVVNSLDLGILLSGWTL